MITDTDRSHYYGSDPGIDLEKLTNGEDADEGPGPRIAVGRPVMWTYVISNRGNVPLTEVVVEDDQGVAVDCPATTLSVNESITCTASNMARVGQYQNLGTVTAYFGDEVVSDSDLSHYYGAHIIYLPTVLR